MVRRLTGLIFFILPSPGGLETVWMVEKKEQGTIPYQPPVRKAAVVCWSTKPHRGLLCCEIK